jgi:hypothetical protein
MALETSVLPTAASLASSAVLEQVPDGHRQVVVGVHQPALGDDAVAVGVGVVAEGDVVPVLQADQARHGVGRAAVHADLAVVVHGHEGEGRVEAGVHHLEVQAVALLDGLPVLEVRAAHGVDTDLQAALGDRLQVDDARQVLDVRRHVVVLHRLGHRLGEPDALDLLQAGLEQRVGAALDDLGGVGVRRAAVRRVVLEAAAVGRVMRGGDDHAVGQPAGPALVVGADGVADDGGGGPAQPLLDAHLDAVGDEHLEGGGEGGLGEAWVSKPR